MEDKIKYFEDVWDQDSEDDVDDLSVLDYLNYEWEKDYDDKANFKHLFRHIYFCVCSNGQNVPKCYIPFCQ